MALAQGAATAQKGENSIGHVGKEKGNKVLNWRRGKR